MRRRTTATATNSASSPSTELALEVERAVANGLRLGDSLTLTSGRESYPVEGGGLVEVGPVSATVLLHVADEPLVVYKLERALVEVMFQAEFALKQSAYRKRREEFDAS